MEVWRPIAGIPDYMVSSFGRVRSHKRGKVTILNPPHDKGGYRNVVLRLNGEKINRKVHRLVAEAFLPNPQGLPQVNHKDEVRDNNHISNLEWCDCAYNVDYSQASTCTVMDPKGNILVIRNVAKFCREKGLSSGSFTDMLKGRRKQHKGYRLV